MIMITHHRDFGLHQLRWIRSDLTAEVRIYYIPIRGDHYKWFQFVHEWGFLQVIKTFSAIKTRASQSGEYPKPFGELLSDNWGTISTRTSGAKCKMDASRSKLLTSLMANCNYKGPNLIEKDPDGFESSYIRIGIIHNGRHFPWEVTGEIWIINNTNWLPSAPNNIKWWETKLVVHN